jgi:hypothetical protein
MPSIKARAVSETGFWAAGRHFTHDEATYDLSDDEYAELQKDPGAAKWLLTMEGNKAQQGLGGPDEPLKGVPRESAHTNLVLPTLQTDTGIENLKRAVIEQGLAEEGHTPAQAQQKLAQKGQEEARKAMFADMAPGQQTGLDAKDNERIQRQQQAERMEHQRRGHKKDGE